MPEEKKTKDVAYENNPFMVALEGIKVLFDKARTVAILLLVVSVLGAISSGQRDTTTDSNKNMSLPNWSLEEWLMFSGILAVILLAILFVSCMISGIGAYTASQLTKGHAVSLREAFNAVLERFFSYIWLQILTTVKILLWSLLLVVPGIVMAFRYSLANVAFFDKDLRGNAAIKESLRLTKGAWLTTFASQALFSFITLGVMSEVVSAGARSVLYRQFSALKDGEEKPEAHLLSWLTALVPLGILIPFLILIGFLAIFF